jgi:hypothetical protein
MNLSPHFTLAEFTVSETAARYGIDNTPSPEIIEALKKTAALLEEVRALLGQPIVITSGYRCQALNTQIGGALNSAHMTGQAADFLCPGFGPPLAVCDAISASAIRYDQLIYEFASWTHLAWADTNRMMALTIDRTGTRSGLV